MPYLTINYYLEPIKISTIHDCSFHDSNQPLHQSHGRGEMWWREMRSSQGEFPVFVACSLFLLLFQYKLCRWVAEKQGFGESIR